MTFTERVKAIRDENEMSQQQMADHLGLTRDAYANFEYDRIKNPNAKRPTIIAICREFNINEEWLINGEGEMHMILTREAELAEVITTLYKEYDSLKEAMVKYVVKLDTDRLELLKDMIINFANELIDAEKSPE